MDSVDAGKLPGEFFKIPVSDIPENKIDDFSLHQLPSSNLLKELQELYKVEVTIFAAQVESVPKMVKPDLPKPLTHLIPKVGEIVMRKVTSDE